MALPGIEPTNLQPSWVIAASANSSSPLVRYMSATLAGLRSGPTKASSWRGDPATPVSTMVCCNPATVLQSTASPPLGSPPPPPPPLGSPLPADSLRASSSNVASSAVL